MADLVRRCDRRALAGKRAPAISPVAVPGRAATASSLADAGTRARPWAPRSRSARSDRNRPRPARADRWRRTAWGSRLAPRSAGSHAWRTTGGRAHCPDRDHVRPVRSLTRQGGPRCSGCPSPLHRCAAAVPARTPGRCIGCAALNQAVSNCEASLTIWARIPAVPSPSRPRSSWLSMNVLALSRKVARYWS